MKVKILNKEIKIKDVDIHEDYETTIKNIKKKSSILKSYCSQKITGNAFKSYDNMTGVQKYEYEKLFIEMFDKYTYDEVIEISKYIIDDIFNKPETIPVFNKSIDELYKNPEQYNINV